MKTFYKLAITISFILITSSAYGYIGPGAGLSVLGSVLAFLGAIILMIVGFFWYPIKRFIKNRNKSTETEEEETTT